ncbi:glutathione S-transferase family protein [Pseudooceanicola sp. CBS1P-1]|uniref:Glutathione S-transferase n=1 Tax=Pseudooceanicola albus TaxID=2692189 RepID=A0A6L7FZI3_9RHOB|nr:MULTISPECIES: glutathione S-transferase family protein [Pseudooceanicola]MBT9382538.1 glutathione S-transferase family protein [Pseudooceanicola endophyticus]MXN17079.1 glutathione S-transferase [Pseudooceanicola albus]
MITLHHCAGSRSMRILWLLNELDVPFEVVIHPLDEMLQTPELRVYSPVGLVPALQVDGENYFESLAILQILCERFRNQALGRFEGDFDRPDWLVWVQFSETLTQYVDTLCFQRLRLEEAARSAPVIAHALAGLRRCFEAIEGRLSTPVENRAYLLTSGFSAADIAVGQAVWMGCHFLTLDDFPETRAWFEAITARAGFDACRPEPGTGQFPEPFYTLGLPSEASEVA